MMITLKRLWCWMAGHDLEPDDLMGFDTDFPGAVFNYKCRRCGVKGL